VGTSGPGGYGPGDPNHGVMSGGGGGGGGGGGFLKFIQTPAPLGVSARGLNPKKDPTTILEERARAKADEAAEAVRTGSKIATIEELLKLLLKMHESDRVSEIEDLRRSIVQKIAAHRWNTVYAEEVRSAVDRLADLAEDEA